MSMFEFSNQLRITEEQVIILFYNYLEKRRFMKNPHEIQNFLRHVAMNRNRKLK